MLFGETATPIGLDPTGMVATTVLVAVSITETVLEKILVNKEISKVIKNKIIIKGKKLKYNIKKFTII